MTTDTPICAPWTRLTGHTGAASSIAAFEADGLLLTASQDHTSIIWDLETGTLVTCFKGHTGVVRDCLFAPGGRVLITAGDTTIRLWDR